MTKRMAGWLALGVVTGLAGCAMQPEYVPPSKRNLPPPVVAVPAPTPVPPPKPAPPPPPPPSVDLKPVPQPTYRPMANDQCGANALQYLVGKPRTEIPVPIDPAARRVVCSTCVTTQEYRADRQTIIFDTNTGLIKSVGCG